MYQNIFDSHAHYNSTGFDKDREKLLAGLPDKGIAYVLNAATDISSCKSSMELAEKYDYFYFSAGIHPSDVEPLGADYIEQLKVYLAHEKCVAVGEIGLDYHYDDHSKELQQKIFKEQVILSKELDKPIIVHDRDAHADTLAILKKYRPRGIVHCYSGSAEMAKELINLGFYIGFTGVLTFKNARRALEALEVIPLDRLLFETDCPYMAPEPFRGKRCNSSMIPYIAMKAVEVKGEGTQKLLDITCENAKRIYNIK